MVLRHKIGFEVGTIADKIIPHQEQV